MQTRYEPIRRFRAPVNELRDLNETLAKTHRNMESHWHHYWRALERARDLETTIDDVMRQYDRASEEGAS